jgi:hypothetical protein
VQVGDLIRERTRTLRKCSLGVILETQDCRAANCECGKEEYLVHFFDDNDKCWMSNNFLEAVHANKIK